MSLRGTLDFYKGGKKKPFGPVKYFFICIVVIFNRFIMVKLLNVTYYLTETGYCYMMYKNKHGSHGYE